MSNTTRENPMFSDDDIIEMARGVEPHDFDRIAPPPVVWNNILAEVEVEVASQEATARRQTQSWFSSARLLSVAAATLLMVGVAVAIVSYRGNDNSAVDEIADDSAPATAVPIESVPPVVAETPAAPATEVPTVPPAPVVTELATASMTDAGLPVTTTETADARFVCEDDQCFVELNLTALPEAGANDLELWVINGDVTDMHSLGNVNTSDGRFALPEGVTADDFPIVDISVEPDDGDETHSGQSVLRGVFA